MSHDYTNPRTIETAPNCFNFEAPIEYADGYRVTVGWSEEDGAWVAEASGHFTGSTLAHGVSQADALCSLCCALACSIDVFKDAPRG